MHIKMAVLRAPDAPHDLEDVELRDLDAGKVLIKIAGVGMCHTDLLQRAPGYPAQWPLILGHEGAGMVEEIGPG
ncbi:alcohol dehydrogenase catalytic domain-containing protein [Nonomuraea composti]|uniref:alcohol dehydrogenase catalytic domain-containing protein n=1 Tax=Nonomuraea composti TaxID=2720023 RepID=UPI001F0D1156|nr:alcohol dehydrogenase catalytic domain-containing protein [Nonomuraea sp. FMUSA5-5]